MARRSLNIFSLSFLDAMTCGFGAVILFFMIINANMDQRTTVALEINQNQEQRFQLRLRSAEIVLEEEQEDVMQLLEKISASSAYRDEMINQLQDAALELEVLISQNNNIESSLTQIESEIASIQTENDSLAAAITTPDIIGNRIREVRGDGNRQYLTGLRMSGRNVVILVDASGSMLARSIIDIFRLRNMDEATQLATKKWNQAVNTVDWLTAQLEPGTNIQIIAFNERAWTVVNNDITSWMTIDNGDSLDRAVESLRSTIPTGGTSLHEAFNSLRGLNPKPDNVYLLVDGLPTLSELPSGELGVSGRERLEIFSRAVRQIPLNVPINIILYPMEGDPQSAPAYWLLALNTGGSMIAPSEDWP
jgi:hypothetical protein